MLERFIRFINENRLFSPDGKILLAVSGGSDSVAMLELFHQAKFKVGIAHCNFQLRGKESDRDEQLVKALAKKYKTRFFSKKFPTQLIAKEQKLSIQEAARKLRYDWLLEIGVKNNFDFIATAHHLNDSIETFLINLLRGTGLSGLTGIHPVTVDGIVRPLLFAEREEIDAFVAERKLKFREDSSNATDDYLRNRIRHHLIPVLKKLNPSVEKTMSRTLHNIFFANHVFNKAIIAEVVGQTHHVNGLPYFSRKALQQLEFPVDYLYEFLGPFDYNAAQVKEIWECSHSGKVFYSGNFRVICDRDKIILAFQQVKQDQSYPVKASQKIFSHADFTLRFKTIPVKGDARFIPPNDPTISCLDASLLRYPLEIRKWKPGDSFYPLGMKNKKKLSDLFIDGKLSIPEKENMYVLLSGNDIVCVPGHRIDDRYKVTDQTKKVLRIDYLRNLK